MPRKRTVGPDWLPKHTSPSKGWWVHRPYLGMHNGKRQYGPAQPIAKIGCTPGEFYAAYNKLATTSTVRDLNWLLTEYHASDKFRTLSASWRQSSEYARKQLCAIPIKAGGKKTTLGTAPLDTFSKVKIRKLLDSDTRPINNRRIQYLKAAWNWAEERYEGLPPNPCNIELNPERPRDRYIEDWEYAIAWLCAARKRVPIFAPAMELAYLCRARRCEVFAFTTKHLLDTGIHLVRTKGSKGEITKWGPRLAAAVEACKAIHPNAPTPIKGGRTLLHDKAGLPYTKNALDTAWQRVIDDAINKGAELPKTLLEEARRDGAKIEGNRAFVVNKFTYHDIKTKGVTDHDNHESGHKSKKMEAVYNVKPKLVDSTK